MATTPPLPPGGLPNITTPIFHFDGCENYVLGLELPREKVQPFVPAAFRIQGMAAETASVNLDLSSCPRALSDNASMGPAAMLRAYVFVSPTNVSWKTSGLIDYYLLEATVNNAEVQRSMASLAFPVAVGSLSKQSTSLPDGTHADDWTVDGPGTSGRIHYPWYNYPPQSQSLTFTAQYWTGDSPFARFSYKHTETATGFVGAGEVVMTGDGKLAQAMGTPLTGYTGQYGIEHNESWKADGEWKQ